jgi:hypothetical protein
MIEDKLNAEIQASCVYIRWVGERSVSGEGHSVRRAGADRSENAGMSNEIPVRIRDAEYPRFPTQRLSSWGKSGPNTSPHKRGSGWTTG